ncbi:MAG TPA: hypothetical protein VJY39_06005 [Acidisphaera sp.]|nr:hypothetical protein [Acidisphaera sp.]
MASGLVLALAEAATYGEPGVLDLTVPLSLLYAAWVVTRRVQLPMRLPIETRAGTVSCASPSCARAATFRAFWSRAGWPRRR